MHFFDYLNDVTWTRELAIEQKKTESQKKKKKLLVDAFQISIFLLGPLQS